MIIRSVQADDQEVVLKWAEEFIEYHPLDMKWDRNHIISRLNDVFDNGIFLIAEKDNVPIGSILGVIQPHFYDPTKRVLTEMAWWVDTNYRNGTVGMRLLKAFEDKGKQNGCDIIIMTSTINTPKLPNILEKKGYSLMEHSYARKL